METCVYHLKSSVSKGTRDHFGTPVMSVEPGFGGQSFTPRVLDKVRGLRVELEDRGLEVPIEIDGGVGPANAADCRDAGATWLVAGSAIFGADDPAAAIRQIRGAA